jgi:hypothetical protein
VLILGVLGLAVIVTRLLTSLGTYGYNAVVIVVLAEAVALAANIGMYFIAFRLLTPKADPTRKLVPDVVAERLDPSWLRRPIETARRPRDHVATQHASAAGDNQRAERDPPHSGSPVLASISASTVLAASCE